MRINDLKPGYRANRETKRLGRGTGSGQGTSAGKGTKGQKARKSGNVRIGFEGGQMPLIRRIPKRGFCNVQFATVYEIVNLETIELKYSSNEVVDKESLKLKGIIYGNKDGVKILGNGELTKTLTFTVDKISKSAKDKVSKSGGVVNLIVRKHKELKPKDFSDKKSRLKPNQRARNSI